MEKIKGKMMVGYRYGKAPISERSYNSMNNKGECGVSMAQVGRMEEIGSFATDYLKEKMVKKYYYSGIIAGEGGDDGEICMISLEQITYKEYRKLIKNIEITSTSNDIVNFLADRKIELLRSGWNLGDNTTEETVNAWRARNLK